MLPTQLQRSRSLKRTHTGLILIHYICICICICVFYTHTHIPTYRLSIAFIRYRLRASCEFAKEAMTNQALDGEECLNCKWAYDDPNPLAQDAIRCVRASQRLRLVGVVVGGRVIER